jgi:hypothetical protein
LSAIRNTTCLGHLNITSCQRSATSLIVCYPQRHFLSAVRNCISVALRRASSIS